jgi:hypothetical protein
VGFGGGYGYGGYGYGGGFGMSPGTYLGLSLVDTLISEQRRQAYLQQQLRTQQELGKDQAMIQQLQRQVAEQDAKVDALKAKQGPTGQTAPAAQDAQSVDVEKMRQQLLQQQMEIDALKQKQSAPSLFPR